MGNSRRSRRRLEVLTHIIVWVMVFAFPLLMDIGDGKDSGMNYLRHCLVLSVFPVVFYLNYCILIPRKLFSGKAKSYYAANAVAMILASAIIQLLHQSFGPGPGPREGAPRPVVSPVVIFFIRDLVMLALTVTLAAAIRLAGKWSETEIARREAEKSRTEAELRNLHNQLNPHFLLNTLNNIYALIAFDSDKAQVAVKDLSRLLRYVLYDNQHEKVPLVREVEFIRDYISLMRIRLSRSSSLVTEICISPDSHRMIAPLIFISLIENAFKHGISTTGNSHIKIVLAETDDAVVCDITNSCHPKDSSDRSGSGVGLEQVRKRLDLSYSGKYIWEYGPDSTGTLYRSKLMIYTDDSEMCDNR